jgi:hypothetical protein
MGRPVEYWSCPMRFVSRSVQEFLAMRRHLERFPHTAVAYHEQEPRFIAFESYYSSRLSEFEERVRDTGGVDQ